MPPGLSKADLANAADADAAGAAATGVGTGTEPAGGNRKRGNTGKKVAGPARPPQELIDRHALVQYGQPAGGGGGSSDDGDDAAGFGPMPAQAGATMLNEVRDLANTLHMFEARSKAAKKKIVDPTGGQPARDTWMTELPDLVRKNLGAGLVAREFRKKAATVEKDTSAWTDTPADRQRKMIERMERRAGAGPKVEEDEGSIYTARDNMIDAKLGAYNAQHRSKSLVEMHLDKKAKKKASADRKAADAGKPAVRKRFDPDTDLEISRMKPMGKQDIRDKTMALSNAFASSSTKRYL